MAANPAPTKWVGISGGPDADLGSHYVAGVALTPKYLPINASASGDNTVVAAVPTKKIRVLRFAYKAAGTVTVKFTDGPGGTALTGPVAEVAQSGMGAPYSPAGVFETSAGNALVLNLSGIVQVSGSLTYVEVPT